MGSATADTPGHSPCNKIEGLCSLLGEKGVTNICGVEDVPDEAKRFRGWFMTWNNPPDTADTAITSMCDQYVFQHEVGDKEGTPHVQGFLHFKEARKWHQVRTMFPGAYLRACKNWQGAMKYCSKQRTRIGDCITNIPSLTIEKVEEEVIHDPFDFGQMKPWQSWVLNRIKENPDPRKIHWLWEPEGGVGKSVLCKHICLTRADAICVSGKVADVLYAISEMKKKPSIVLWDIPRCNAGHLSYQSIESLKNGLFFNTKYEAKMVMMNIPHIVVFSNQLPETDKLSEDRWDIRDLRDQTLDWYFNCTAQVLKEEGNDKDQSME